MKEKEILRRTMTDRVRVTRWVTEAGVRTERTLWDGLECALSRGVNSALPKLGGELEAVSEDRYRMMLYLPAGTVLLAGDRVEVRREGQIFSGISSGSVGYPSFAAAGVEIQEVKPEG